MNDKVIVSVDYNHKRIRTHIKRELIKQGLESIKGMSARLLLLPELEEGWIRTCQRFSFHWVGHVCDKERLLALTTLHQPINHIVHQMRPEGLREQGMTKDLGVIAKRLVDEWKKQGKPKEGPIQIGETLLVLKDHNGRLTLRTIDGEEKNRYLVTKVARTQEIRWGELTIPATKPRTQEGGNTLQEIYFFRSR